VKKEKNLNYKEIKLEQPIPIKSKNIGCRKVRNRPKELSSIFVIQLKIKLWTQFLTKPIIQK
jgi:hypothetical protein